MEVDGETVSAPGLVVDSRKQEVRVDGRPVRPVASGVWMLNKPPGVLSTVKDPHGGKTVLDLAREAGLVQRVYPVGRLDLKSRGLVLLSNDGDLAHRLLHPRFGVPKIYRVKVNLPITRTQMRRFAAGVELADGRTRPCRIRELPARASYEIELKEGRKRQIRRMFEAFGRRVTDLQRVGMGPLSLGRLPEGEIRPLSGAERGRLKEAVGLS